MDKYKALDNILIPRTKGIILDFDGVIVDLFVNWQALKEELSNTNQLPKNLSLNDIFSQIKEKHGSSALQKAFLVAERHELMFPEKSVFEIDLLRRIRSWYEKGIRLSIFSNNMLKTINYFLAREKLTSLFDPIISKERVINFKPDPEGLLMILSSWRLTREEVLYVGNSSYDKIAGEACGVNTVII